jgi:uncharacterized membrane protein
MIGSDQAALIYAVLLAVLVLALVLERTRLGRVMPGPAIMLVCAVALANLGVIPHEAPAYADFARVGVPVAVFLLLLRANLVQIVRETGAMLPLFLIGAATSLLGLVVAYFTVPLHDGARIAAVQAAQLIGGNVNVIAVAHATGLGATSFSAMLAGGAPIMTLYLMVMGVLATNPWLKRVLPGRACEVEMEAGVEVDARTQSQTPPPPIGRLPLAAMIAAAVGVFAVCDAALRAIGQQSLLIIAVTLIALAVANLAPRQVERLSGDREIGSLLMYLFFATLGAAVDLRVFGGEAIRNAMFLAVAVVIHLVAMFATGIALRAQLHEVLVASIAGIAGPTTAAAMAGSFGRRTLVTPGILCGLLGFATATFVAMAFFALLSA